MDRLKPGTKVLHKIERVEGEVADSFMNEDGDIYYSVKWVCDTYVNPFYQGTWYSMSTPQGEINAYNEAVIEESWIYKTQLGRLM